MSANAEATTSGQRWVEEEIRRLAQERNQALRELAWRRHDADTFHVHFTIGENEHAAPVVIYDLEEAVRDTSVQRWLASHLRKATTIGLTQ